MVDHIDTAEQALEAARKAVERRKTVFGGDVAQTQGYASYGLPMATGVPTSSAPDPVAAEPPPSLPPPAYIPPYISRHIAYEAGKAKIRDIQEMVCFKFHCHRDDMLGPYRAKEFVFPRHVSIILCRLLTQRSLPEIGYHHGGRDHTTVINALRKHQWLTEALREKLTRDEPLEKWVDTALELTKSERAQPLYRRKK